ncbi:hypothetical protein A3Q56_03066 [Intoshia linei]|uniref:Uncharacterized protein n=1 Tax=Intoshia linei TaxID=1819745 RepID=A0A177B509_9BILA|nr:hypothetical protein A3Q56_03066 [Intoshia linei]
MEFISFLKNRKQGIYRPVSLNYSCKSAHGQFLIDTGSTVNLIAIDMLDALCIPKPYIVSKTKLIAANGQSLIQYGTVDIIANDELSLQFFSDQQIFLKGFSLHPTYYKTSHFEDLKEFAEKYELFLPYI